VSSIPSGKFKPVYIDVASGEALLSKSQIQTIANTTPGAVWYVGGEPNRRSAVDDVIEDLRYYYVEIKLADPTARITSPSILNWDFTCVGCGGYTSGRTWMTEFVTRYQDLYGTLPPWDIWAIDLYPIDWLNLPNTGFLSETIQQYSPDLPPNSSSIAATELQRYRDYIDSLAGKSGEPIIITELGLHYIWTEIDFTKPECGAGSPKGIYKPIVARDYFDSIYTWLEQHAVSHNIERWFTFTTYVEISKCRSDGYAGISLLDSPSAGSNLSDFGRWFVGRSGP